MKTLQVGTRVRVCQDKQFPPGPWPAEPTATIVGGPEMVRGRSRWKRLPTYGVRFDEPQRDVDGDGPYESSQVLGKYLEVLHRE